MGEKILKYYKWAEDEAGLMARIQLAQRTKVPSVNAALVPDDPDTLARFRDAVREVIQKEPPVF